MAGFGNSNERAIRQLPLITHEGLGNPQNEEKIVYVAVGLDVKENESALFWAIRNFSGWAICILHVYNNLNPCDNDNYNLLRILRGLRDEKMLDYLQICTDNGVRAKMVDIEMHSAEEGILKLVEMHHIKRLIMGADENFNSVNLVSTKARHVNLQAPPFCTVYFVCNGHLIYTREGRIAGNEPSTSSNRSQMAEMEAVCKVTIFEKLYAEELRKRKLIEEELTKITEDRDRVVKEAQDQKIIFEEKISVLQRQNLVNDQGLMLVLCEQEKFLLQEKLDDAVRFAEDLLNQSLETHSRIESSASFSALYDEELRKRKVIEEELEKIKRDRDRIIRESHEQNTVLKNKVSALEQQKVVSDGRLLILWEQERADLQARLDDTAKFAEELLTQSLEPQPTRESSDFLSTLSYSEIVEATNGLNPSMIVRETEHGNIFKGLLYNTPVTTRMLFDEVLFKQEVGVLFNFRHPNLGNIIGSCQSASAIVYADLPNGSLEECLACTDHRPPLSWQGRIRIAHELCSALIFLHFSRPYSVIHGSLRPSCIFLDTHFTTKVIGFDFSHIIDHDESLSSTHHATTSYTNNYTDPLFLNSRELSPKCDVYSFGIILLELLTGFLTTDLVDKVRKALDDEQFGPLLDDSAGDWPFIQSQQLARLGLRCCDPEPSNRPDLRLDVWEVLKPMVVGCRSALTYKLSEPTSYFLCPISYDVMRDPQVAADGYTYEAGALKQWLDGGHNTSPMTNLPFEHNNLTPNLPLRSSIQEWLQHQ